MRILHLVSCQGWSSDAYWAGRIVRELQERDHDVTLVAKAGTEAKVLSRLEALGVRCLRTLPFAGRRAPLAAAREIATLRDWIAEHDVVHAHRGKEHWLAVLAGTLAPRRVPLFRTRHIVSPVRSHPPNRWLYARTAHVVAVSRSIRDQYVTAGLVPSDRVSVLAGGVDHRRFHPDVDGGPFLKAQGLQPGARVVGVLGQLRPMKGHPVLLEAARMVRDRRPATRFVLVGDGPGADSVRRRVIELGLQDVVVMAGFIADPERAVAAFDVAVYPSLSSEGMGRVIFEYMAAGRPIVATRVGLAAEVLSDGDTGWLVDPGDPVALAGALEAALTRPALAARLARAGRCLVETAYSGAMVAATLERLYRQAIDRGGAAS